MVLLEGKMTGAGAVLQMDMIGFSCSCYYNLRQSQRMILVHVFNELKDCRSSDAFHLHCFLHSPGE